MEKESARNQTLEQLHERRKQVVRLHIAAMGIMKIVALTGLTYPTVRSAIDRFEQGGWEALKPKARGRLRGTGRVLSAQQETLIQEQIRDKRPEELGMSSFLWSRAAVGEPRLPPAGAVAASCRGRDPRPARRHRAPRRRCAPRAQRHRRLHGACSPGPSTAAPTPERPRAPTWSI